MVAMLQYPLQLLAAAMLVAAAFVHCPGDVDGDGSVGASDLALVLGGWGGVGATDLDGDGTTGAADLAITLGAWGECPPASCPEVGWLPQFTTPGVGSPANALAVFDDGTGSALYFGGSFTEAGGLNVSKVARWDVEGWSALAGTITGTVQCLLAHDDGSGPALYAGGTITSIDGVAVNRIARWDGHSWSPLGEGLNGTVLALASYDDGSGPALYAGGSFTAAGGSPASRLAKWDGTGWSAVGGGTNDTVRVLAVEPTVKPGVERGLGPPGLLVGGDFTGAGSVPAKRIARWGRGTWSEIGGGTDGPVLAIAFVGDAVPSASGLVIGGCFTTAGGVPALRVARWSDGAWSALGAGFGSCVSTLAVFDDGGGPTLVAGGAFSGRIARWDGQAWAVPPQGGTNNQVSTLAVLEAGTGLGPALVACGQFDSAGGIQVRYVGRLDASGWSALGQGVSAAIVDMLTFDDGRGGGPMLYATGSFTRAGGVLVNRVARWDGQRWSALGSGLNDAGYTLGVFDDGSGPALYVGGRFTSAGGVPAKGIAKWDGATWSGLGSGVAGAAPEVYALRSFGAKNGTSLYVGGAFTTAGGIASQGLARWDGANWHPIGVSSGGGVTTLEVFNDLATGAPTLHAGGAFSSVSGTAAVCVAAFDGRAWQPLGSGVNDTVWAIERFDGDGGPAIFVGGAFTSAGGSPALRMAKWNGRQWSALGGGMSGVVYALAPFNDGAGTRLFAAGAFAEADGTHVNRLAAWDGQAWQGIGAGIGEASAPDEYVSVLEVTAALDDGPPALAAGGFFQQVDGAPAANIAVRGCR